MASSRSLNDQPFDINKLRRLATESESFEGYMERVIPELLAIKPKQKDSDNSILLCYKEIIEGLGISCKNVETALSSQVEIPLDELRGDELHDLVSLKVVQKQHLSEREDLIILCFAIVACGGTVDQCDKLARAGVSDKIHSRELYQLDAREGFFRFVLYWNQRCHWERKQNLMITYSQACKIYNKEVSKSLRAKIDAELKELENLLNQNIAEDGETKFINELMENLQTVKNSTETGNIDLSRAAGLLQNMYKRFSRGETNDDAKKYQGITTAMKHDTSAWTSEVEELVNNVDLDQNDGFISACALYTEMAGNFIGEKDWTAVSIIIKAICSDRYRVNYRYYKAGKPKTKKNKRLKKKHRNDSAEPSAYGLASKRRYVFSDTSDVRISRAILPEELLTFDKGNIGRLVNPTMRYISVNSIYGDDEEGLLIPEDLLLKKKSGRIKDLVSLCGLFDANVSNGLNGVVETASRQTLLRFAIACNYTAISDYVNILGLSGKKDFIVTNRREMFVLSVLVWISIKYGEENYSKFSVLETIRYAELILLYYLAGRYYEGDHLDVYQDYDAYFQTAIYVDQSFRSHYEMCIYFYSIVYGFININADASSSINKYTLLLSGFETPLPFTKDNMEYFELLFEKISTLTEDSIIQSNWKESCEFLNQTIKKLSDMISGYRKKFENDVKNSSFKVDLEQYLLCIVIIDFCSDVIDFLQERTGASDETLELIERLQSETEDFDEQVNMVFKNLKLNNEKNDADTI